MGQAVPFLVARPAIDGVRIKAELRHLLDSSEFRASDRNKRFLEFVVTETLEGRGERIKAYTIAVDVFGRGEDFDPSIDPIVRIEATRLRVALSSYYAGPGAAANLQVLMPKGKYIPSFVGAAYDAATIHTDKEAGPMSEGGPLFALVEAMPTTSNDALEAIYVASELTIEGLRRGKIRVLYVPPERRVAARKSFEDLLKEPGSAVAIDIIASGNSISWRISRLASSEIISTERIEFSSGIKLPIADIQKATARIVQFVLNSDALRLCNSNGCTMS